MTYTPDTIRNILDLMADDPLYFGKIVAPQYFTNNFAGFHRHMIHKINNIPRNVKIVVVEAPRGRAKTLIVSTLNPLHRALFAPKEAKKFKYIVIGSFSNTKAKQIISDYRNIIMGEPFQGIFPDTVLPTDREDVLEVYNKFLDIHFQVMARGRDSQIAGLRFEEARPNIFVGDDLENPDESYNQDIVDKNENFVNEVVQFALDPNGYTILIGTPFAFDCTTERFAKYPKGVMVIRYPGLVEDPEMANELGIPIGSSIWEDRFPTERVIAERDDAFANGTIDAWMRQIQLNPSSSSQVRFDMNKIVRMEVAELGTRKLNVFILADFAYSKHIWADESAIIVFGVDDEANYYILHSDKGKWGDIGTTDKIVGLVRTYIKDLKLVGVETRGFGFIERQMMDTKRAENLNFALVELKPQNRSKPERIKSMISLVDDGRVIFVGSQRKLEEQLVRFRGEEMKHGDDLADVFGYIKDIAFKPTTQKTIEQKEKDERHKAWVKFVKEQQVVAERPRMVRSVYRDSYY